MDYNELANLIFPDAKGIEYYEEKYPERNLEEGAMVTRFAPSPTGFVHIGGLFGAIIDRKLAEQSKGVFILRIEDTDQKREIENGTSQIVDSLKDFGINPDEGMILLDMPDEYILEMICDWWSFSWAKGDLYEIFNWYNERKSYIKLSDETREKVEGVLDTIKDKLDEKKRKHEEQ